MTERFKEVWCLVSEKSNYYYRNSLGPKYVPFLYYQACFSLGSALVDCLSFFAFLRFCAAAFAVGLFVAHYVFVLELVGPTYRTLADKVQSLFWCIGAGLIALLGHFIPAWRTLLLVCSFPPIFVFVIYS